MIPTNWLEVLVAPLGILSRLQKLGDPTTCMLFWPDLLWKARRARRPFGPTGRKGNQLTESYIHVYVIISSTIGLPTNAHKKTTIYIHVGLGFVCDFASSHFLISFQQIDKTHPPIHNHR
jgi:hypothetical protein